MATVATITSAAGIAITLEKFLTPLGRVPDVMQIVEEPLEANGVDGRRFRTIAERYPEFQVETIETQATYQAAVSRCRQYEALVGTNVKVTISNLGGTAVYTYPTVHVRSVGARAVPGTVAGSTSGALHVAHVDASWTLEVVDVPAGSLP